MKTLAPERGHKTDVEQGGGGVKSGVSDENLIEILTRIERNTRVSSLFDIFYFLILKKIY